MNQFSESLFKELDADVIERVRDWSSIWSRFTSPEANAIEFCLCGQLGEELNVAFD